VYGKPFIWWAWWPRRRPKRLQNAPVGFLVFIK